MIEGDVHLVPASQEGRLLANPWSKLPSVRQLSSLFVKDPACSESHDQLVLAFICQEKELELAYQMTRQLLQLMKNRQGDAAAWIGICSQSGVAELEAFALSIQKRTAFLPCSMLFGFQQRDG
jgi:hypothetical protein